jgi:hypothetical protein
MTKTEQVTFGGQINSLWLLLQLAMNLYINLYKQHLGSHMKQSSNVHSIKNENTHISDTLFYVVNKILYYFRAS